MCDFTLSQDAEAIEIAYTATKGGELNMGQGQKVAGLVIGILGLICAFIGFAIPYLAIAGLPLSIVGLVLAVIGNKAEKSSLGTAAFVLCLLAVIFTAITFFTCGICALAVIA